MCPIPIVQPSNRLEWFNEECQVFQTLQSLQSIINIHLITTFALLQ